MAFGSQISLEEVFSEKVDGEKLTVLAEVILFMPGCHLCRTGVRGQLFRTDISLTKGLTTFTIFDGEVEHRDGNCWLKHGDHTKFLQHQPLTSNSFQQVIEACSGIGAVGTGYHAVGAKTVCYCDVNSTYCSWLRSKFGSSIPVVEGDVGSNSVIHAVGEAAKIPSILSSGIACQPYSALGDRREGLDPRSMSLPSTLKMGYLLRSPLILLECTKEAFDSDFVQHTLKTFMDVTGFKCTQRVVHLHHTWPSNRTRWWAVLSHPCLPISPIKHLPQLDMDPVISNLLQIQPLLKESDLQQLQLSISETRHFCSKHGGIASSILNHNAPLPTATHSWGSQLTPCFCGCRSAGFSHRRLQEKGLYGILIPLGFNFEFEGEVYPALRHPHPAEVAILLGLHPDHLSTEDDYHLRFLLSGVGQMASPFQGAWILGCIFQDLTKLNQDLQFPNPYLVISDLAKELCNFRRQGWDNQIDDKKTAFLQFQFEVMGKHGLSRSPKSIQEARVVAAVPEKVSCPQVSAESFPTRCADQELAVPGDCPTKVPVVSPLADIVQPPNSDVHSVPTAVDVTTKVSDSTVPQVNFSDLSGGSIGVYTPNGALVAFSSKRKITQDDFDLPICLKRARPDTVHVPPQPLLPEPPLPEGVPSGLSECHAIPLPAPASEIATVVPTHPIDLDMSNGVKALDPSHSDVPQSTEPPLLEGVLHHADVSPPLHEGVPNSLQIPVPTSPFSLNNNSDFLYCNPSHNPVHAMSNDSELLDPSHLVHSQDNAKIDFSHEAIPIAIVTGAATSESANGDLDHVPPTALDYKSQSATDTEDEDCISPNRIVESLLLSPPLPSGSKLPFEDYDVSPTQEWTQPAVESMHPFRVTDRLFYQQSVWVCHDDSSFHLVPFADGTTIGQLVLAEAKLLDLSDIHLRPVSAMGSYLSMNEVLSDKQFVKFTTGALSESHQCPLLADHQPPDCTGLSREHALWQQMGWVAVDEMTYYLNWQQQSGYPTTPPLVFRDVPDDCLLFGNWVLSVIESALSSDSYASSTCCFIHDHWFPLRLEVQPDTQVMTFFTATSDRKFLQHLIISAFGDIDFELHCHHQNSVFHADCGFQSLASVIGFNLGESNPSGMSEASALQWRLMFDSFLLCNGRDRDIVLSIRLGGIPEQSKIRELTLLLEQHGVNSSRSTTLATQLVKQFGLPSIAATLASPRPWSDLKTKASGCSPPIQLVLSEELQQQIEQRRQSGKGFGRKANKTKNNKPKAGPQPEIILKASQIQIPASIFQQSDGTKLTQISLQQFQQRVRGIVVLNKDEAEPFLQLREPLSSDGIGILLLDFKDVMLPDSHRVITFPASCVETQEPMIVTAALVQLGKQEISRVLPANPVTVEQIETRVVRCVLYKDQAQIPWKSVVERPFKSILSLDGMQQIPQEAILDVWDRQFLNKQFQKTQADHADLFSVTCRFTDAGATIALNSNATAGLYTEPRAPHGRESDPAFKVVWLPKRTFPETVVASQATAIPTAIARAGDRYGLRTAVDQIQQVHDQHRPGVTYMDTSAIKQFRISPLPFGTTRNSLQKVCKEWSWNARPSHTQGLTKDQTGLVWIVSAASPPDFFVWTMAHGDVLIAEVPPKTKSTPIREQEIVASHRTLKHLIDQNSQKPAFTSRDSSTDLLQVFDPWSPKPAAVSSTGLTNAQIAKIESNVERKVIAAVESSSALAAKAPDASMDSQTDSRIQTLEKQVSQMQADMNGLASSLTTFQQQQSGVNQQLTTQMQQVRTHLDQHTQSVQGMLDQKLEDQMARIEALLKPAAPAAEHPHKIPKLGTE